MSNVTPYLGFLTVSLMIALSPGPSWAYTISTTLGHGKKCGMIGNLGNSAGILCHALAVALGLVRYLVQQPYRGLGWRGWVDGRFRQVGLVENPHHQADL